MNQAVALEAGSCGATLPPKPIRGLTDLYLNLPVLPLLLVLMMLFREALAKLLGLNRGVGLDCVGYRRGKQDANRACRAAKCWSQAANSCWLRAASALRRVGSSLDMFCPTPCRDHSLGHIVALHHIALSGALLGEADAPDQADLLMGWTASAPSCDTEEPGRLAAVKRSSTRIATIGIDIAKPRKLRRFEDAGSPNCIARLKFNEANGRDRD